MSLVEASSPGHHIEGVDKIFSFESVVAKRKSGTISGAGGYFDSGVVPTGKVWEITNLVTVNATTSCSVMALVVVHDGSTVGFYTIKKTIAIAEELTWGGRIFLDAGDYIRVYWTGSLAGDSIVLDVTGVQMNAP